MCRAENPIQNQTKNDSILIPAALTTFQTTRENN